MSGSTYLSLDRDIKDYGDSISYSLSFHGDDKVYALEATSMEGRVLAYNDASKLVAVQWPAGALGPTKRSVVYQAMQFGSETRYRAIMSW